MAEIQPSEGSGQSGRRVRVRQTGIALVHRGEWISAAPGFEADLESAGADERSVLHVHLPVEVVISGALPAAEREAIIQESHRRLRQAFEATTENG